MKGLFATILVAFLCSAPLRAQTKSLLIEDMTWTEVRDAIAAGKTTAIYYAGSIEQNGPGMALGKHVFIARYLGPRIAEQLGDALVYPVMPFAPTGDWGVSQPGVADSAKKTHHMRYSGPGKLVNSKEGDGTSVDGDQTKVVGRVGTRSGYAHSGLKQRLPQRTTRVVLKKSAYG